MLDLHRIVPDKKIAKVLDASHGSPGLAFERALAPAHNALVRLQLYEDIRPVGVGRQRNAKHFQVSNLDARTDIAKRVAGSV